MEAMKILRGRPSVVRRWSHDLLENMDRVENLEA